MEREFDTKDTEQTHIEIESAMDNTDDSDDARKYLEEVMGIVEDEEFNRERRERLRKPNENQIVEDDEYFNNSEDAWCCTKVTFIS